MVRVPRLDLREWQAGGPVRRERFAKALRSGFEATGFVVIEGHGVDASLTRRMYALVAELFALDAAARARYRSRDGGQRGFTPFGVEHARDHGVPDLKEFFHIGRERPAGRARGHELPANIWPSELPELRPTALALYAELDRCAEQLLEALACAYGLPGRTLAEMLCDGNSILRALHYPRIPPEMASGSLRAAPHEDINLITLLCEATESGLEIETPDGWLAVEAQAGQIVANTGDMLQQATGGVIPSTTHRVANRPADRERYSLPFFAHPRPECDLSVLEPFATPARREAHPAITARAFLERRLREIGLRS